MFITCLIFIRTYTRADSIYIHEQIRHMKGNGPIPTTCSLRVRTWFYSHVHAHAILRRYVINDNLVHHLFCSFSLITIFPS